MANNGPPAKPPLPPRARAGTNQETLSAVPGEDAPALADATPPPSPVDLGPGSATPPPARVDAYIGKTIDGRYIIDAQLGEGGMGVVYRGRHKVIDKKVAIKVLRGDMAKDAEITERFLQEARAASAIGNPHIIDISDFGQLPDGSTYFVMEFLDGKSLGDEVAAKKGPMPVARLCHIARQIAQGLAAAHAANIVHRDLKPDNVMLIAHGAERDFVKILDFGIAKVGGAGSKVTRAGSIFGTPHYMSPEQAAGAVVDHRTDIYALGVILYELASGRVPFDADNFMGILTQHMYKAPVPIRALVPEIDVPPGLDAIILKALTKKPEGRYRDMGELVADLEKLEKGLLPDAVHEMMARSGGFNVPADYFRASAMPAPVPASPAELPRTKRWPLLVAIAAAATVVGIGAVALVSKGDGGKAQAQPTSAAQTNTAQAATIASAANAAPPTKATVIAATPADAVIKQGDKTLANPALIELAENASVQVVVSRDGYETQTVTVNAGETKSVPLARVPSKPAYGRPAAVPAKSPAAAAPPAAPPKKRCDPDDPFCH